MILKKKEKIIHTKNVFMLNPIKKTITLPDGREITLETGKLAKQALHFQKT